MKFELTILGCGGAIPTLERKPTAQYLNIQDRHFLIDCGEGTQIQLRKYNCKFSKIDHIFISHLHGDHFLGLFGYLSTLSLLGRTNCIYIYAPKDLKKLLLSHHEIIGKKLNFDIEFIELNFTESELIFEDSVVEITSFPVFHSVPCCGFIFKEKPSKRRIIKEKIEELGLSIEAIKKLKNRENFEIDGSHINYEDVTTAGQRSRSYAYCADTSFNNKIIPYVENSDLLYHEATFLETQLDKAVKTRHSTATQAATIALNAHVKQLLIGHFSARYKKADEFIKEAKKVFKNTVACYDGYIHEIKK
jgi:ribonuclease Z